MLSFSPYRARVICFTFRHKMPAAAASYRSFATQVRTRTNALRSHTHVSIHSLPVRFLWQQPKTRATRITQGSHSDSPERWTMLDGKLERDAAYHENVQTTKDHVRVSLLFTIASCTALSTIQT